MMYASINLCVYLTKMLHSQLSGAISSEEIIKYAHRISASNAVCAPLTWVPGKNTFLFIDICENSYVTVHKIGRKI